MQHSAFLQTKLQRPHLGDDLVSRPQLLEQIYRGLERPLTLISAPAGFGKTTLLSAWMQSQEINSAWISLDENDDDPRIFFQIFVTAIQRAFPDACNDIYALLKAPQLPSQDFLATNLVNELVDLPEIFVLVLDDYHFIQREVIHQVLTTLIHHMPPQMHLMIATRKDPPFQLSLLRSRKQLLEIRAADLRFTPEEAKLYLEGVIGVKLDPTAVSSLTTTAEGWVTGLRLAALSIRGQEDLGVSIASLSGRSFYLREYLFNEVLSRQTKNIQDFLLQTSILDQFCATLCDAVTGASGSDVLLEDLTRPNLFLIQLDLGQKWYRYHNLFRDLLRHRLKRTYSPEEINRLHHKASSWFASNGMVQEALNHALTAGDLNGAAKLIENSRHNLLNDEDWFTLERWLNKLPDELVQRRPALLLARAWTMELRYQMSQIPPILLEVEKFLSAKDADVPVSQLQDVLGEIDALKSVIDYTNDEGALALERALTALEHIPIAYTFARSIAIVVMALALQSTGQSILALDKLNEFLATTSSEIIVTRVLISQIYIHMMEADLYQAEHILNQLQSVTDNAKLNVSKVFVHWVWGRINYERNKLDRACKHFSTVFELRYGAQFIMVHDSMLNLAMCAHAQGLPESKTKALTALRNFSHERGILGKLYEIDSFEARLALYSGNKGRAIQWAQSIPSEIPHPLLFLLEIPIISKAQILIRQGTVSSVQEATRLLEKSLSHIRSIHNSYHEIRVLACLALAYQAQGRNKDAQDIIELSLKLAQPAGFIRTYLDFGSEMVELLKQTAVRGFEADYINQIIAPFSNQNREREMQRAEHVLTQENLIEPLTRRERQVLVFLGKWLTDKEIAQELVISPRTVKKHTSNIYSKLGVKNRMQAVEKAKDLGLLKS